MNPRYYGPEILPPAPEVRKRIEEHLESLPTWRREVEHEVPTESPDPARPRGPGRPS